MCGNGSHCMTLDMKKVTEELQYYALSDGTEGAGSNKVLEGSPTGLILLDGGRPEALREVIHHRGREETMEAHLEKLQT